MRPPNVHPLRCDGVPHDPKIRRAPAAAALLSPSTAACGSSEHPTPATPASPDKVNAGVIAIVDVAPIYLGKQKGFFTKRNIDLTLETAQGGAGDRPGGGRPGSTSSASATWSRCCWPSRKDVPIKVVANGNNSTGDAEADFGGLVVKDPAITSPKDLEGKKVATNTLKNIVDTIGEGHREEGRRRPDQGELRELAFPDMAAALDAGQVDAIFVVEPFLSAAKAKGWKRDRHLRRRRPEAVRGAVLHLAASSPRATPTW